MAGSLFGFGREPAKVAPEPEPDPSPPQPPVSELKSVNVDFVEQIKALLPHDQAMEHAIGAGFEQIGAVESALVSHFGLPRDCYLIDVGCGSGRLALPLSCFHDGRDLGVELLPDLVEHARKMAERPDWRFREPMNVFIERSVFPVWAEHLGLEVVEIRDGGDAIVPEGNLGQAICVLQKPL